MIGVTGSAKAAGSEPRGPSVLVEAKPKTWSKEPNTNRPFGEDKDGRVRGADGTAEEEENDDDEDDEDANEDNGGDDDEDDEDDEDDDDEDEAGDDDIEDKLDEQENMIDKDRGKEEDKTWRVKAASSDETLQEEVASIMQGEAGSCSLPTNSSTDVCCRGAVARIQTNAKLRML